MEALILEYTEQWAKAMIFNSLERNETPEAETPVFLIQKHLSKDISKLVKDGYEVLHITHAMVLSNNKSGYVHYYTVFAKKSVTG